MHTPVNFIMQNIDYIESGRVAGCSFCTALATRHFAPEQRVRLLSGCYAGKEATVVDPPENFKNDRDIIIVQMDEDDFNTQQRVNLRFEIVERFPYLPVPIWAPQISIRKTCDLHERIIGFCDKSALGSAQNMDLTSLYALIWHIWNKRLPLEPNEVWNILDAHGVPKNWRNQIKGIIKHGLGLLITMFGKKPIKKFLVKPMTVTLSRKYGFSE